MELDGTISMSPTRWGTRHIQASLLGREGKEGSSMPLGTKPHSGTSCTLSSLHWKSGPLFHAMFVRIIQIGSECVFRRTKPLVVAIAEYYFDFNAAANAIHFWLISCS